MKLIVGLGNPGERYVNSRHNFGFRVLDQLAVNYETNFKNEKKFEAEIIEIEIANIKVLLAKPQTFMNNSGISVNKLLNFYKILPRDLILIFDDKDLKFGEIRIRTSGSSAGHKGVQSVIDNIGTTDFTRFRLGIMNDEGEKIPTEAFVLQNFRSNEEEMINEIIGKVTEEIASNIENC